MVRAETELLKSTETKSISMAATMTRSSSSMCAESAVLSAEHLLVEDQRGPGRCS